MPAQQRKRTVSPLKSRLRLFLSVDIVGSTAFKQRSRAEGSYQDQDLASERSFGKPWLFPFSSFYLLVDDQLAREWERFQNEFPMFRLGQRPEFWKSLGDELIYTKELQHHGEAQSTLLVWIKTVAAHRQRLRRRFPQLDLKMTAWTAGFPIHNWEILFRSTTDDEAVEWPDDGYVYQNILLMDEYYNKKRSSKAPIIARDFIGPSIDTGFRLCSLSSPRKFIISVDLAFLVLSAAETYGWPKHDPPCFMYEGRAELKGVLGGQAYPIVSIDLEWTNPLFKAEREVSDRTPAKLPALRSFCKEFLTSGGPAAFLPYIEGDPTFQPKPAGHEEALRELKRFCEAENERRAVEQQSAALANTDKAQGGDVSEDEAARVAAAVASKSAG